jgi:amiloride-sensitive sodium channel
MSPYNDREILLIRIEAQKFIPYFYIHSPFEYPIEFSSDDFNAFEWEFGYKFEVLIIPEIISSSDDFSSLSLNQRNCYLENERKLKFFKIYSQKNCQIECLSQKMLESCGCVPYDVIRDSKTKICDFLDYTCLQNVRNQINIEETFINRCNCLQSCDFISYSIEIVKTKQIFIAKSEESEEQYDQSSVIYDSFVYVRFKENEFVSLQRVRQFTIFDYLSYIGGLLGLFAGISVLSLFEIFYFLTLRLVCEILRVKRGQKRVGCRIVAPRAVE